MNRLIFGITGGTGTGKSTAARFFRDEGVYVADADKAARLVVKPQSACLNEIIAAFGDDMLLPSGELDRKKLGSLVFSDEEKLSLLNEITHKYIKREIEVELEKCGAPLFAIDGAVLITSPLEKMCRYMVCVLADRDVRAKRICLRDNISAQDAKNRINSQPGDDFYIAHGDFIIRNDSGEEELREQVKKITTKLRKEVYEQAF